MISRVRINMSVIYYYQSNIKRLKQIKLYIYIAYY